LPVLRRTLKLLNRATHVVLFIAGFLGRGFNSRRLHHYITVTNQMARSKTQIRGRLERILVLHPVFWALAGAILFTVWGGLIPRIRWNAVEMMIGRNLLLGNGFVMAPLDPPALWRPPFAVFLCALVELFNTDPFIVYRAIYAVSLTTFLIASFYAAKALWDTTAAHLACIFILTSGAMTGRLVSHIHGISHVAFLLAIGPALWCTVWALRNLTRMRLLCAGVCWGVTYCARWETLLYFVVTAGVLLYALHAAHKNFRSLARISMFVLGFALLFAPAIAYQSWAKARYRIWGPSAITTFYASEAWVTGTGDEDAGFAKAESLYGSLESNRFSLFRAIVRNPSALRARLGINVPRFLRLFADREFFDPAWLILIAGFGFDLALTGKRLVSLAWLGLLFLCSTTVCLFQIDPRYSIVSLPCVLLILCGGVACFANGVQRIFGRGKLAAGVACLLLLGLRSGSTSYRQLIYAETNPVRSVGARTVEFARDLARHFRQVTRTDRPSVLMVRLDGDSGMNQTDMFLVPYFAGTAIAWPQPTLYPRDKIFSMTPKEPDYIYVPQGTNIVSEPPIAEYQSQSGVYYLFRTSSAMRRDDRTNP
jgi:hypothetical protein